ncbi:uncharacterized protein EI90DRAFT_2859821, partial [Cantharellus anzutake]|uniref:uncharacterized protein n=1 Tax=Cantharellus anzutake TaxID=1750568 RepID=UPI0019078FC7
PDLNLHSAASKGNIALVEYALTHGQPANSVLDGILPIHAAAASGSEQVLNLILNHGADVNAARLPRKLSGGDKSKVGNNTVGTSGSTALHFAAANGH